MNGIEIITISIKVRHMAPQEVLNRRKKFWPRNILKNERNILLINLYLWLIAEGFIDGRASRNQNKKYAFSNFEKRQNLKLLPRVSVKYFLKASFRKDVAPNESDRRVQKLCKSDLRYWNYNNFYKIEVYGPVRKSLTEEQNFWLRNILTNKRNILLIKLWLTAEGFIDGRASKNQNKKYAFSNFEKIQKFKIAPAGFCQIFSESKHWEKCSPEWIKPFSFKTVQIGRTVLKL